MATPKKENTSTTKPTTERQKCQAIFDALLPMLRTLFSLIDSLLQDRETLQIYLKIITELWSSDVRLFDDQIAKLEKQISLSEMSKLVEKVKAALLLGSETREVLICVGKLENLQSELDDFKAWFDILSHRSPNKKDISPDEIFERPKAEDLEVGSSNGSSMHRCKELEKKVAKLKREYEKLSVEKSSSESALQAQINFVWNQYKEMESNYDKQLQTKSNEVHEAKEEVKKHLAAIKQLQSSTAEKDIPFETLKANITRLRDEASQKDGEVTKLSKELESLKSPGPAGKPVLHHCSSKSSSSRSADSNNSVETLKAYISNLEREARHKDREIARLTKELESLKSPGTAGLPTLKPCPSMGIVLALEASSRITKNGRKSTDLKAEANNRNEKSSTVSMELQLSISKNEAYMPKRKHRELSSSSRGKEIKKNKRSATSPLEPAEEQVPRRSPRKQAAAATIDTTPKLFTSQFKVPKLKTRSPLGS